jgi:hypothetical protein
VAQSGGKARWCLVGWYTQTAGGAGEQEEGNGGGGSLQGRRNTTGTETRGSEGGGRATDGVRPISIWGPEYYGKKHWSLVPLKSWGQDSGVKKMKGGDFQREGRARIEHRGRAKEGRGQEEGQGWTINGGFGRVG